MRVWISGVVPAYWPNCCEIRRGSLISPACPVCHCRMFLAARMFACDFELCNSSSHAIWRNRSMQSARSTLLRMKMRPLWWNGRTCVYLAPMQWCRFADYGCGEPDATDRSAWPRSRRYCSSQPFRIEMAGRKSWPHSSIKSILLVFAPQLKQCAKFVLGFTVARSSLQCGH